MITPAFNLTATERVLPKLALDFTTASLDSRVTFTRSGNTATVIDSSGHIAAVSENTPRFDYNPTTLVCKGLLIEESRTNTLLYSVPDAAVPTGWTLGANTGTWTNTLTPDTGILAGLQDMFVHEQTVSGRSYLNRNVTLTTGVTYTLTLYVDVASTTATGNIFGAFNFTDATFVNGSTKTVADADANGRLTITFTVGTDTFGSIRVGIGSSTNDTGVAVYGGWQLEAGAFATSYIPTTASQVTRTADVATMTGTNFSDWFNASEGSFEFVGDLPALFNGPTFLKADNGTENERYFLYGNASFSPTMIVTDGGVAQASRSSGTIVANTQFTTVYGYKLNDFGISTNAGSVQTDTAGTLPTVSQLGIGCNSITPSAFMNGHVAKVFYWPQKLTSNEIRAFSK